MQSPFYGATRDYLNSLPNKTTEAEWARLAEEAKRFKVTHLPYSGERSTLKFDRRTYTPLKKRIGQASSVCKANLDWNDYKRSMHMTVRATAEEMRLKYTPLFASNDDQLRLVIAQQGYDYAVASIPYVVGFYGTERVPEGFVLNREALESLCKKATEAHKMIVDKGIEETRHIMWCEAYGGYVALRARIAYMAWREAKSASVVAEEIGGLTPYAVRQILFRLCDTARALGLPTFKDRHWGFEGKRVVKSYKAEVPAQDILKSAKTQIRKRRAKGTLTLADLEAFSDLRDRLSSVAQPIAAD